jgi:hypothetical protein
VRHGTWTLVKDSAGERTARELRGALEILPSYGCSICSGPSRRPKTAVRSVAGGDGIKTPWQCRELGLGALKPALHRWCECVSLVDLALQPG